MVQWSRLCDSNAEGSGLIAGWGAKLPHAMWPKNKVLKKKKYLLKNVS